MGVPLQEQLDFPHRKANKDCEGCHGAGWLTALVDNPAYLEDAGITEPADFLMKCGECEAYKTDDDAIRAARRAGMNVDDSGLVHYSEPRPTTDQQRLDQQCGCGARATHKHHGMRCCGGSMCCSKANI